MKYFIILSLLSFSVFAREGHGEKPTVAQIKEKMNAGLDKRITTMQEAKTCVSKAETHEALKACRQGLRENRKELKEMREKKRADKKEQ